MKTVVTSEGPDMNSAVDPRFGRAKYFVLCDMETGEITPYDNQPDPEAQQGAGLQAGRRVASLGASVLVTGDVGPKAFLALNAGGITVYVGATGSVQDALDDLLDGRLRRTKVPTVEGHKYQGMR